MAEGNRAVVFHNPGDMRVDSLEYPKLVMPNGKKAPHGAILKMVATNICGSDLHIFRGSFPVPEGMVMGHEMTGEVVEVGSDVEFLTEGDLVSVPFNVACGRCRNCKARRTDVCETTNADVACGAYGFNLGDWQGGQAEYLFVPYADFQLLRFPDKDQAMEKILDLALLSDILPTAFHGLMEAGAKPGAKRRAGLKVNSIYGIFRAVQSGVGIGALPDYMSKEAGNLVEVLPQIRGPIVDTFFVYPEELRNSARIAVFREFLIQKVAADELQRRKPEPLMQVQAGE